MTSETSNIDSAPSARRAIQTLLDAVRDARVHVGTASTIRDVVQTRPTTRRCALGPLSTSVSPGKGRVRNQRGACAGFNCDHCVDYRVVQVILRALRLWGCPEAVYLRVLPAAQREARRLRAEHPLHMVIRQADEQILFSPAPIDGGVRVPTVAALLDELLDAPCAKRRKAFEFARTEERREREAGQHDGEREERYWTRVARFHTMESLGNRYTIGVGRALPWESEYGRRGAPFSVADEARDLAETDVEAALRVFHRLREEAREDFRDLAAARRAKREAEEFFASLPEDHYLYVPKAPVPA